MGVNNKQRRAAKQRQRARQRTAGGGGPQRDRGDDLFDLAGFGEVGRGPDAYAVIELELGDTLDRIATRKSSDHELLLETERLLRSVRPHPEHLVARVLADLLAGIADAVIEGGWGPDDLGQLVRRNAGSACVPVLAAVLHEERRRTKRHSATWKSAVENLGADGPLRLDSLAAFATALQVAALLNRVPLVEAGRMIDDQQVAAPVEEHPKLARVRALLAKAESTEFDEEAEALSAKAQELISIYALGRLLDQRPGHTDGTHPQLRRVWLDAPYVVAKASLVGAVAGANRCRSAVAEKHGFCILVGSVADLDAVELLVTSLLVQANTAMLRQGRRHDRGGTPRTRSFRQAFLMAYAAGIGERLRAASDVAAEAAAATDPGRFLPVLRDHEERVAEAFESMVPHTVGRARQISNGEGWAAGLAAADLAQLDVNAKLADRAG